MYQLINNINNIVSKHYIYFEHNSILKINESLSMNNRLKIFSGLINNGHNLIK